MDLLRVVVGMIYLRPTFARFAYHISLVVSNRIAPFGRSLALWMDGNNPRGTFRGTHVEHPWNMVIRGLFSWLRGWLLVSKRIASLAELFGVGFSFSPKLSIYYLLLCFCLGLPWLTFDYTDYIWITHGMPTACLAANGTTSDLPRCADSLRFRPFLPFSCPTLWVAMARPPFAAPRAVLPSVTVW